MIVDEVAVRRAVRLSPSFVRVELGGDCLADLGVDGPWLDQRVKLVLPGPTGVPPDLSAAGSDWWGAWCALPEAERGTMRTYTVRDVVGEGADQRLVVDVVVHEPSPGGGDDGPGNAWARGAAVGDRVLVVAPRRGHGSGGREFDPAGAREVLLAADETAVPAAAGILRDLPCDAHGTALLEVPVSADVQRLRAPDGVGVLWLPRDGAARGARLHAALVDRLGPDGRQDHLHDPADVEDLLWDTPARATDAGGPGGTTAAAGPAPELYAWVAGEAGVVARLRRHLVRECGLDRRQVAFMGYWREGVAMRA